MKKKTLIIGIVLALCIGFVGFKNDDHNFQVSKNLDVFNSIFKELDLFYVDTINPQ